MERDSLGPAPLRFSSGRRRFPLLWWVFSANATVLVVATVLLVVTPIEISAPIAIEQLAVVLAGLVALLVLDLVLVRRVLAPLVSLTTVMSSVNPDRPGRRLVGVNPRASEGAALADAFNDMLDRLEDARREAAHATHSAQEAERLRVARELHDEIGQTLTAVVMQADRAAEGNPALAREEFIAIADAIRDSLDEVRRIARELRPEALDDLGLVNALIALCSRIGDQGLPVRHEFGPLPPLTADLELVVYRVAQESLTNALRHARATSALVSLSIAEGNRDNSDDGLESAAHLVLSVADDGQGIPTDTSGPTAGIIGMGERALLAGGQFSIESRHGPGTRVVLTLPLGPATHPPRNAESRS